MKLSSLPRNSRKNLAKFLSRAGFHLATRSALSCVSQTSDQVLALVGEAMRETARNKLSHQESVWVEKIETLRETLQASSATIAITDYGTGVPNLQLSAEEMYNGRVLTKTIGDVCRSNSKSYFWSLLLFKLIRKLKPASCLELGTCLGISAAFQAAALKLNGAGTFVTLEGAEPYAALAQEHFHTLHLDNITIVIGRFQDKLREVLSTYGPLQYAFIDGHHDEHATVAYFEQILPFLSKQAVLVFDDISWSQGMQRAWNTLRIDKRVQVSLDLKQIGICIMTRRN